MSTKKDTRGMRVVWVELVGSVNLIHGMIIAQWPEKVK